MKTFRHSLWVGAACLVASLAAQAHDYAVGSIAVGHPYTLPTVKGQSVGGGYLTLENKGTADDKLVSVSTKASQSVELHSMSMDGDIARMRQIDAIEVPAGKKVELKSGGLHLMFVGLKEPFKVGSRFPVTLKFEKAGEVQVELVVEERKAGGALPAHH